jgi:hypothetical protein
MYRYRYIFFFNFSHDGTCQNVPVDKNTKNTYENVLFSVYNGISLLYGSKWQYMAEHAEFYHCIWLQFLALIIMAVHDF